MAVTDSDGVVAPAWMTRTELAQASGLREDLIARFIPAADTPTGPMYAASQLAEAVYIKELTDQNLHPAAVENKVYEFRRRQRAIPAPAAIIPKPAASRRGLWAAIGGTAAAALLLGGVIGGLIGSSNKDSVPAAAPMVTVAAAAPLDRAIPNTPDPVCAEWAPIANAISARLSEFASTDPRIPGSAWTPQRLAETRKLVPVLEANVADMRRLAGNAQDPFLASLMRAQAVHGEAYIARLGPNYQPSDQSLWQASIDYSSAVRAACTTVAPR
jgi:hypothetical protein